MYRAGRVSLHPAGESRRDRVARPVQPDYSERTGEPIGGFMYGRRGLSTGIALLVLAAVFAGVASAEVYKWVDDQGNVHFGDKPRDEETARRAEQVDIVESYQPTELTAEEQSTRLRDTEALRRSHEVYQQEDREARQQEAEQRQSRQAALCDALAKEIAKFSEIHHEGGRPLYYYLKGEDGKSVSSERQREYVAELRQKSADAGCE